MASPAQVPPTRRQPRSFAGPVVLIVMGTALLLANMGVMHWSTLGMWFARYWPALIILWGVIKLVEYQQAQRQGLQARGIGAGGVILLIALIVFGLSATQASHVNWGTIRDNIDIDDGDFAWFGHSYSYDDQQIQQAFPAGASLHVVSDRGTVNVNASDGDQIKVVIHKRIVADTQGDADKWNAGTKPQITASDRVITLNANTQGSGDHRVTTDMEISVPRKAAVVITTRRGDTGVMGRDGDVEISSQHGEVSVNDINGKVTLNLEHSSTRVSRVSGDVSVDGRVNDTSIEDVKGAVSLNGEFMEGVKLARIAKSVRFKSSRTDMEMTKLDGELDLDSGDLRASDITGPVRLSTRSKDIRFSGVNGDVRLQDENGSVEIEMKKMGSIEVDNRRGDVQLFFPENAGFQLDARARGGDIQSDFNELKVDNGEDTGTATGSVRGGGPKVVVNNEHGTIEIRKGSALSLATPPAPATPKTPRAPGAKESPLVPTEN